MTKRIVCISTVFSIAVGALAGEKSWLEASHANSGIPFCNPQRTGYTPQDLKPPYRAVWVHAARHPPRPAWREPGWEPQRIDFDYAYAVSAHADSVYYAGSSDHALHALDLHTGLQRWRFITDAPVRLAPEFHGPNVLFGSDDGFIYCLSAKTGQLVWKYRPNIPDRRLIGNEQMISRWPARSGVLVEEDRVYTTFGMLAPEGVAVCCLDARTGKLIWINDTCGYRYMARPHLTTMGGVSPQGYMAVCGDRLVLTCGRSTPALFDKNTGECLYHEADGDFTGGSWTMTVPGLVFTPADTLRKEFGSQLRRDDPAPEAEVFELATLVALDVNTGHEVFSLRGGAKGTLSDTGLLTLIGRQQLLAVPIDDVRQAVAEKTVIMHTAGHFVDAAKIKRWSAPVDRVYTLLQAKDTIIAGGQNTLECFDASDGRKLWQAPVQGQVRALCITSGRLIASTTEGRIYCFTPGTGEPPFASTDPVPPPISVPIRPLTFRTEAAHPAADGRGGYCLVLGETDAPSLAAVAQEYDLVLYAATAGDPDWLRQRLMEAGLYGSRIVVHRIQGPTLPYTDYFADTIHLRIRWDEDLRRHPLDDVYRLLRPCGGVATVTCPEALVSRVRRRLSNAGVPEAEIAPAAEGLRITRGSLPGAGQWTHQYADPGKTCASSERRVRLPLKAVWFGGLGPATLVSRHFRGPAPLVMDGRCFAPGTDHLTAMSIYNGRVLWQRELPNLAHWPAAYRGPSLAVDPEFVYALQGQRCLLLDPATGQTRKELAAPSNELGQTDLGDIVWEYLAAVGDAVIGSLGQPNIKHEWWSKAYPVNHVLFALDRKTGSCRWVHRPEQGIDSSAIAIDDGRVFLIDGRPRYAFVGKHGWDGGGKDAPRKLRALDLTSGQVLWETNDLAPTLHSLWVNDGVVVATIAPFCRSMVDVYAAKAGGGVTAYSCRDGSTLWQIDKTDSLTPFISEGVFYTPLAYDLKTGRPVPARAGSGQLSAEMALLCGTLSACPTLAMARQSSLGFKDLVGQSGTYQYPIVRSSCWINMIPAGGLIVVPEGGSSCTCAYNYKTSLALMSDDRHFHYGLGGSGLPGRPGLRVNFGAPGDHPDPDGQMWRAYPRPVAYGRCLGNQPYGPKVAGPPLPIEDLRPKPPYRMWGRHPDWVAIADTDTPWLHSCGLAGSVHLAIRPHSQVHQADRARVVLYFCELEEPDSPRVFDVKLQNETVLRRFNIAEAAGGPRRAISREFPLHQTKTVTLELTPQDPSGPPPIITGMAILAE